MQIKLIAHTQLSKDFVDEVKSDISQVESGKIVALTAIRTCYSSNKPSEIASLEGEKYFQTKASCGEGTEADRLIRHIVNSKHLSTLEHLNFTFAIEGVSRSLLAQLTRHRHFSYSVQSQRYVKLESGSRSGGFDYATPETIDDPKVEHVYQNAMNYLQVTYDHLRKLGIPAEDARYVLPNAATCNLVLTGNLRSLIDFYSKRGEGTHAQSEIKELAERIKDAVYQVEPWTKSFFEVI